MIRLSLTLGPLHLVCEVAHGAAQEMDRPGQLSVVASSVCGGVDTAGESVSGVDGTSYLTHGHVQTVGANCRRDHWVGLKCPDHRCEWGWGTSWLEAVPAP